MQIRDEYIKHFGQQFNLVKVVQAPGRVNVIGEHTDYNDGFVFPAAIDKFITIAGALRDDQIIKIYSLDYQEESQFHLSQIIQDQEHLWANYLAGVIMLLQERGLKLQGMNLIFTGTIPNGAGLSSSAAIEVATAYLVKSLHQIEISPIEIVQLCQRAENEFVGMNCGIMDQYISCLGMKDHALLLDCRSLESTPVPLFNAEMKLVVANTNVRHNLIESGYNQRCRECEAAVRLFSQLTAVKKDTLRDVTVAEFRKYGDKIENTIRMRAEHVIFENQRVVAGVAALQEGNLKKFGELMYQSHASLKDLYQVSCSELDLLVDLAKQVNGVYGSRMTGGGFGGCTVSIVKADQVESFISYVGKEYEMATGIKPEFYNCQVVDGADRLFSKV